MVVTTETVTVATATAVTATAAIATITAVEASSHPLKRGKKTTKFEGAIACAAAHGPLLAATATPSGA